MQSEYRTCASNAGNGLQYRAIAMAVAIVLSTNVVPAAQAADAAGAELTEVTVTGSRIVRRDLVAASPVVTVENQAFEQSSTLAVESVLNQLPQYTPANTQFNTSDVFPTATSTPGISTVSLRGLGANRTLVLVDGRRAQPANSTLVIDTNSIPSSALESVEIISGGASAVYGADALGGVTNFKLKKSFQGLDLQYHTGITERGDGQENSVSMLMGSSIAAGRGNAMLGMEWSERGEVLAVDRPYYQKALFDSATNATSAGRMNAFQYEPSTTGMSAATLAAFQAAANGLFPERPAGYNVPTSTQFLFNTDATLYKLERQGLGFNGISGGNTEHYKIAPNGQLIENNLDLRLSSPMKRYSMFGKADYKVTDNIEAFSSVNFVNTTNRQVLQPTGAVGTFGALIPYGSAIYGPSRNANGTTNAAYVAGGAYGLNCPATGGCTNSQAFPVPAELAALLNARGASVFPTTGRTFDPVTGVEIPTQGVNSPWRLGGTLNFLPVRSIENTTTLYQMLGGFRGNLGLGDWTWEAYLSHGATRTDLDYIGFASTKRFQAVVQAPNFGKGFTTTGLGSTTLTCTSGLPIFQQFTVSQDCIKAITGTYTDRTRLTQDIVEATTQGKLWDLPAGELRGAAGLTWRRNDFQYYPDATREVDNVTDIPIGTFGQANVTGSTRVREAYGELLVPLLKDVFLARRLELELGYRLSDYDISGRVSTWKALASWEPASLLRLRGGYQKANRAPNINELFLDASSTAVTMRAAEYCRSDTRELTGNNPANPNRAAVQALCTALIGNTTSTFSADPNNFLGGRGDGVILQVSSGNRNLKSEDGSTWTAGTVISSPFEAAWIARTTLSIDWYRVKITNAIAAVSAQTAYDLCFNRDGVSNPTYSIDGASGVCHNIVRDATSGAALQVNSQYQNVGVVDTSGLDVALDWRAALADLGLARVPGTLSLNLSFNKLFTYKAQDSADSLALENAGTLGTTTRPALYDWRTVTNLRYANGSWDIGLNWRHLPSIRSNFYVTDHTTTTAGAKAYDVFGLTGSWNVTKSIGISAGIDNLFDVDPPLVGAGQIQTIASTSGGGSTVLDGAGSTNAQYYDVLGRRYFVNVKLRF